jgi:hypothetical protein
MSKSLGPIAESDCSAELIKEWMGYTSCKDDLMVYSLRILVIFGLDYRTTHGYRTVIFFAELRISDWRI